LYIMRRAFGKNDGDHADPGVIFTPAALNTVSQNAAQYGEPFGAPTERIIASITGPSL
jgi:hypothetical protein